MEQLDSLTVREAGQLLEHTIELWHGDLSDLPAADPLDFLVASAFPNDYIPTPSSLIGSLFQRGLSVEALAQDKYEDLRASCYCWVSKPVIGPRPFERVLCYEPPDKIPPAEAVGNIFRCLSSYGISGPSIARVAMPLVSTGDARVPLAEILEPLIEAAVNWMARGLPLKRLLIVERSREKALELKGAFAVLKKQQQRKQLQANASPDYDIFISYAHANGLKADYIYQELQRQKPGLKIFMDRKELEPGVAWQQKLFNSMINCRKVLALFSPAYIHSPACQEEFNISQIIHRATQRFLFPVYLYDSDPLPEHLCYWQYTDCRPGDEEKLQIVCRTLLASLS
jgi:hypothetical protein